VIAEQEDEDNPTALEPESYRKRQLFTNDPVNKLNLKQILFDKLKKTALMIGQQNLLHIVQTLPKSVLEKLETIYPNFI